MRVQNDIFNKSSFLSLEKDTQIIVEKMLSNERLKKLLYYSNKECLDMHRDYSNMPILGQNETYSLIGNQIRIVPNLAIDKKFFAYIIISFEDFVPTSNPEYRDNIISFDILCHFDQWNLGNFRLRPYKIAGELDGMFNNSHLSGLGTLTFLGCHSLPQNDNYSGISLLYQATHGNDDKVI